MYLFGSGVGTITPSGANQTPINIGLLQDITIDAQRTLKELYGQYVDPLALGAGTRKWTGKAKVARWSGRVMNAILFGGTLAAGQTTTAYESRTVPTTPFQVTVTNSATFTTDQGVIYAATGLPLVEVASAPTVGQYSYAAGVYTFAAADAAALVVIAYNYTVAAVGQSIVIPQTTIGPTLQFALNLTGVDPTNGNVFTAQFYSCIAEKFMFGTKLEDFAMPEFDFRCTANAAGNVGKFNFPDSF